MLRMQHLALKWQPCIRGGSMKVCLINSSDKHCFLCLKISYFQLLLLYSKATGSSRWVSGGKGQLKGYKSHKDLHPGDRQGSTKPGPKKSQHTTQKIKNVKKPLNGTSGLVSGEKVQGYERHKRSNTAQGPIQQLGIEPDVHADEIHPTSRRRSSGSNHGILCNSSPEEKSMGSKKQGPVRKVSFDLSDEEDEEGEISVAGTSYVGPEKDKMHFYLHEMDKDKDSLNSNRIANLKAKVIAKASARITPDSEKTNKGKSHRGSQPKKTRKVPTPSTSNHDETTTTSSVRNTESQKTPELAATGTELQRVQKGSTKPQEIKGFGDPEPVHTYIQWAGYESDPDEFDQKSSSHSSSDVFFVEPTVNYSKPGSFSIFSSSTTVVEHDPAVTAWLYSLDLLDPEKYSQIFHAHNMTMESVLRLTENQLKSMGVTSFPALKKIQDGIKDLEGKEGQSANKNKMVASSDSITVRDSVTGRGIHSHTTNKDGAVTPVVEKQTLSNESVRISTAKDKNNSKSEKEIQSGKGKQIDLDFLVTGRSTDRQGMSSLRDQDTAKKKSTFLTAEVKKRTLASGNYYKSKL